MKCTSPTQRKFPLIEIDVSVNQIHYLFPSGTARSLKYYVSDLIDEHIGIYQWEFCVVWETRISFLSALSAVPPFLNLFPLRTARSLMSSTIKQNTVYNTSLFTSILLFEQPDIMSCDVLRVILRFFIAKTL